MNKFSRGFYLLDDYFNNNNNNDNNNNNKQLLDEVFEISRIIKVEVWVIGRDIDDNSYRDLDYSRYHKNRI